MSEKNTKAVFFKARALEKEGKIQEALKEYEEVVSIDPSFDKAWFYKFKLHYQLGQIAEATLCAQNAVNLEPKWEKFIREFEYKVKIEHQTQHDAIPLTIPPLKPETYPISQPKPKPSGKAEKLLKAMLMESITTLDGMREQEFATTMIGVLTKKIDGLGPMKITDSITGEVWVIERKGSEITTHSNILPRIRPKKHIITLGSGERINIASKEWCLFSALLRTEEILGDKVFAIKLRQLAEDRR